MVFRLRSFKELIKGEVQVLRLDQGSIEVEL